MPRRHPDKLMLLLGFAVIWSAVAGAVVAAGLALLTGVGFWPAYLVAWSVLLAWGVVRWARALRSYRRWWFQRMEELRIGERHDRPDDDGSALR